MAKRMRVRLGALCVELSLALLAATALAGAAQKPITGKLSKPGYTVIALAANGNAKSVQAKNGKFRFRPTAKRVTLHLRAKDGTYAGPIVVGSEKGGKRAILGIKAGAKLGKIKVNVRKRYAKVKGGLPKKFVDATRKARARRETRSPPAGSGGCARSTPTAAPPETATSTGFPTRWTSTTTAT